MNRYYAKFIFKPFQYPGWVIYKKRKFLWDKEICLFMVWDVMDIEYVRENQVEERLKELNDQ
jgi:hypothetical protein